MGRKAAAEAAAIPKTTAARARGIGGRASGAKGPNLVSCAIVAIRLLHHSGYDEARRSAGLVICISPLLQRHRERRLGPEPLLVDRCVRPVRHHRGERVIDRLPQIWLVLAYRKAVLLLRLDDLDHL